LETPCGIDGEAVVPETVSQEELLKAASEIEVQQNSTISDQINDKTSELENELTHAPEQNAAVIAVFPSSPATEDDSDSLEEPLETPCGIDRKAVVSETVSQEELLIAAPEIELLQNSTNSDQINDKTR
uniref:Uncharacterized protein n=1 Tax=Anopheles atroparvus TaxID=41427 RepID=A0A182J2T9_ANOAO